MNKRKARAFGFVSFLVVLGGALALSAAPIKLKVTAELANIRQKPSISSVIIRQFPEGTVLEAIRQEGEWYLVTFEPDESGLTSGYVHESLVLPLGETPKTERKPQIVEPAVKAVKKEAERPRRTEVISPETQTTETGEETSLPASWTIMLMAGGNYSLGGDLNKGAQGFADFYETKSGGAADKETDPARLSYLFGGEIAISLLSRFYVTVGAEFFSSSKESLISYPKATPAATFTTKPKFQAVPVRLAVMFYPSEFFYFKVGVACYFAKCGYYYRYEQDKFWQENEGDATARGLGLWGSLGFEWTFTRNISLVIEATGQYAPIKGFEGTGTSQSSQSPDPVTEEGKLYAYDYTESGKTISPLLLIRSQNPAHDAYVENAREATVDFSGMSLRAGIKIKF